MADLSWLAALAGLVALVGAAVLAVVGWRESHARAAAIDEAIAWMSAEPVVLRLNVEQPTSLAWAFHQLGSEFERGLSLSRWYLLIALGSEQVEAPLMPGAAHEGRRTLLREIANRKLIERVLESDLRAEQWWLTDDGREAVRRIAKDLARYEVAGGHGPPSTPA